MRVEINVNKLCLFLDYNRPNCLDVRLGGVGGHFYSSN